MNLQAEKKRIAQALKSIEDEAIIKDILDLLGIDTSAHQIVEYPADGQPITYEDLKKQKHQSRVEIKNGNIFSQEELEEGNPFQYQNIQTLNKAYSENEPDYTLDMLKEPNPDYGKR